MRIETSTGTPSIRQLADAKLIRDATPNNATNGAFNRRPDDRVFTHGGRLPALLSQISTFERAAFQSRTIRDALDTVQRNILGAHRALAENSTPEYSVGDVQSEIDGILRSVDELTQSSSLAEIRDTRNGLTPSRPIEISDVNEGISNVKTRGELPAGVESLDVQIDITASAQHAGLYLSFGGDIIDLGAATDRFVIRLDGVDGSHEFSFASGSTIHDFAAAVNSFTHSTGLSATASGTGIRLDSLNVGSDEFVSIRVVDDGNIVGGDGIHRLSPADTKTAIVGNIITYSSVAASNGITDIGQDIEATFNGSPVESDGSRIRIEDGSFGVLFDLSLDASQALGLLDAFTLSSPAQQIDPESGFPGLASTTNLIERQLDQLDRDAIETPLQELIEELRVLQTEVGSQPFDPEAFLAGRRDSLASD